MFTEGKAGLGLGLGIFSIGVAVTEPATYVPLFDVVHRAWNFYYTLGDLADVVAVLVGIIIVFQGFGAIIRKFRD